MWVEVDLYELVGLVVALLAYSTTADQRRFRAARNDCERNRIQDSGGLESCREICTHHPNNYDNP